MRKTGSFAVVAAALILAGIGGWGASNTQAARVATATSIGINPFQMMTNARHLDTDLYQDFSLVFHWSRRPAQSGKLHSRQPES
jgi:hypothetical protein